MLGIISREKMKTKIARRNVSLESNWKSTVIEEVEGPTLMASTHSDFKDSEQISSKRQLDSQKATQNNPPSVRNISHNVEQNVTIEVDFPVKETTARTQSASGDSSSHATVVIDQSVPENEEDDEFPTEAYEISDLFPSVVGNKTNYVSSDKSYNLTQTDIER